MEHQEYKINNEQVFSLVAEEDHFVRTHSDFARRRPGLHPSSASVAFIDNGKRIILGKCMREAWYSALGTPKDGTGRNVSLNMKAHQGKWSEIGMVDQWKKMGIWVANNIKFFNREFALSGELDLILRNPITEKIFGLEMKTFYGYAANRSLCGVQREKGTGRRLNGRPKNEHFLQSLLYAWEYRDELDEYRLYYLERGDGHRIEFRIGFDKQPDGRHLCWWEQLPGKYWNAYAEGKVYQKFTIEDIHERYKILLEKLQKRELPEAEFLEVWDAETFEYKFENGEVSKTDYDKWKKNPNLKSNQKGDWQCSYCDYTDQCRKDNLNK